MCRQWHTKRDPGDWPHRQHFRTGNPTLNRQILSTRTIIYHSLPYTLALTGITRRQGSNGGLGERLTRLNQTYFGACRHACNVRRATFSTRSPDSSPPPP